jgi:hypothetical protein
VHPLRGADDRINGTGIDAQRAADAGCFVDAGEAKSARLPAAAVERQGRASGERGEYRDHAFPARGAAIDRRATGHGLSVGSATVVAAAPALRLRENGIDLVGEGKRMRRTHAADSTELCRTEGVAWYGPVRVPLFSTRRRAGRFARLRERRADAALPGIPFALVLARPYTASAPVIERPLVCGFAPWLGATLLRISGWKVVLAQPVRARCVVIFYPRTSNWDTVIGLCVQFMLRLPIRYAGKDTLFKVPLLGPIRLRDEPPAPD